MSKWNDELSLIESWLRETSSQWNIQEVPERLVHGGQYSLFSGGKRFRPLLSVLVADTLHISRESLKPWCIAVELIHTYSLIHDDLPSMDNDDYRRGQPTLHRHMNEAQALLVGDAFLTEAFQVLAAGYRHEPSTAIALVDLLSKSAGWQGMVGGQSDDLAMIKLGLEDAPKNALGEKLWLKIHKLKTGALITSCTKAAAIVAKLDSAGLEKWEDIGQRIGLIFQMVDDLHDKSSLYEIWGEQELVKKIDQATKEVLAFEEVQKSSDLKDLILFNQKRQT